MKLSMRNESRIRITETSGDPSESNFENPFLPFVAVEHLDSSCGIFGCGEEDRTVTFRSIVWT